MIEVISSANKTSGTNGDCQIYLRGEIGGKYKLKSFRFTNNIYNVNSTNNRIVLADTSDVIITNVTLTEGYYTGGEIATLITSIASGFSASYSANTGKFTFTYTGDFKLLFENYDNTCHDLIGFEKNDYTSSGSSLTSVNTANLTPINTIYLWIEQNRHKKVIDQNNNDYSLEITDKSSVFGGTFCYEVIDESMMQQIDIRDTRFLKMKIYDQNNNILDISQWTMILESKRNN